MNQGHEPQILRLIPTTAEAGMLASVTLLYGPIAIRAKLISGSQGPFLSMPSRRGHDDKWWDQAYFRDRSLHSRFEELAKERYRELQAPQTPRNAA